MDITRKIFFFGLEKSFVRVGEDWRHDTLLPWFYLNYRFRLRVTDGSRCLPLEMHSSTIEDAIACLELLVGLNDDHFEQMELVPRHEDEEDGRQLCPLPSFSWIHASTERKAKENFYYTIFTPDQSRTLATSGTRSFQTTENRFWRLLRPENIHRQVWPS
jgi:hypothetical protein